MRPTSDLYTFDIRGGRLSHGYFFLILMLVKPTSDLMDYMGEKNSLIIAILSLVIALFVLYILISATAKRMLDINLSGWWAAMLLGVPVILIHISEANMDQKSQVVANYAGLICILLLLFWRGSKCDNKYGPPPAPLFNYSLNAHQEHSGFKDRRKRVFPPCLLGKSPHPVCQF